MTTYRLMDGLSGRPGNGPAAGTPFTGNYIAGCTFDVTQGGLWFTGYYWWVASSGQDTAPAGGFKFALWQVTGSSSGTLVPGTTVTAASLTAGQWNFVPLATPLLLTPCATDSYGAVYLAAVGYVAASGFPSTTHQFGAADTYSAGITNGPLRGPSSSGGSAGAGRAIGWTRAQMPFSTAGSDPTLIMPGLDDLQDNLWIDVQVSDTAPANPSYSCFPNSPAFTVGAAQIAAYTLGLQFSVSQTCQLYQIRHFSPATATVLPTRCGLWDVNSQTEVAGSDNSSPSWSGAAGSGWVSVTYANGPVLSPGTQYKVSTFTSDNVDTWFQAEASWWGGSPGPFTSGITQGPLIVPGNAGATPGQDSWNQGATWTYPNTSTNPEFDGIDVVVIPVSSPAASGMPGDQMTSSGGSAYPFVWEKWPIRRAGT